MQVICTKVRREHIVSLVLNLERGTRSRAQRARQRRGQELGDAPGVADAFGPERVGLMTGDAAVNRDQVEWVRRAPETACPSPLDET